MAIFGMISAVIYAKAFVHAPPCCEKIDISRYIYCDKFADSDYQILLKQTGLGRAAVDSLKSKEQLLIFQEKLFAEVSHRCDRVAYISVEEISTNFKAAIAPLEDGDVLVTYSCRFLSWRNGHAAIVVNAEKGYTLEATSIGEKTSLQHISKWAKYPNFIILRLKDADPATRKSIAQTALLNLKDLDYSLTVGYYPKKCCDISGVPGTQCAHLVWIAYLSHGYDIDSRGGAIVTPDDIARSDLFEIVQIFGRNCSS